MRGLDYYTRTAFEWLTDRLGSQSAVCAGGRYDGLVEVIGGRPTPGVGWAMGLERLVELMTQAGRAPRDRAPHAYVVAVGEPAALAAVGLAERLRSAVPGLRLVAHCGGGGFKTQFKAADRSGARVALVLGDDEVAGRRAGMKPLRGDGEQRELEWDALPAALAALIETGPGA